MNLHTAQTHRRPDHKDNTGHHWTEVDRNHSNTNKRYFIQINM